MKKIMKCTMLIIVFMFLGIFINNIYAATANISANKTSAYVGETVTINVSINAAAWNLNVSGNGVNGGPITGFNMEGINQATTKSYTLNTSTAGTYVISLKGDVSDGATDITSDISKSVTVIISSKPVEKEPTISSPNPPSNNTAPNKNQNTNTSNIASTISSNAYLSQFRIDYPGMTPVFNKKIYNYAVTVGGEVDKVNVTAVTEHNKATISIIGNTNLKKGNNEVVVKVTAQDKKTIKTYTINVTKADNPEKSNAYLENIIIEDLILSPEFSKEIFEYEIDNVNSKIDKLNISAFPAAENAKVDIIGNENLKAGANEIKIIVTSENQEVKNTYTLKVIKEKSQESILKNSNNIEKKQLDKTSVYMWQILKEKSTVLLLYVFIWIEFLQVVYLYEKVKKLKHN